MCALLRRLPVALVCLASLFPAERAAGDAIVRSQAMFASTIAEFFVESGAVRVELEVGVADLEAFHNLLPDGIRERLGREPRPLAERVTTFFSQDLVIRDEDGEPLPGRLVEIEPGERVFRDPITGEPLPAGESEPETVLRAHLEYAFEDRPATLTLEGLRGRASIGFVAYHDEIPVNDFRYLAPSQTLELDWEDPWYTRFRERSLRRQYFAPMSGFLYVEPWEVRKEIIARPVDLQRWVDLGLEGRSTIPVEMQPELRRKAAEFLREHQPVVIDGETIEPELARVNFLERSLRTSRVVDPPIPIDVHSAILGVIFVYALPEPMPQRATMRWDLWDERITQVPASSVDAAGPLPTLLEPDFPLLEWQNFLRFPVVPTLTVIGSPPSSAARWLHMARWPAVAVALLLGAAWLVRRRLALVVAAGLAAAVSGGAFAGSVGAGLSDERARQIVSGLLHNIYRAFDQRAEEKIYDVLERSVSGDLLERIYLETRRGLELESQGGARAKVKEIELRELMAERGEGGAFRATAVWDVKGSIGHWGHIHDRANRYRAALEAAPVDGAWKLRGLEILEEERL